MRPGRAVMTQTVSASRSEPSTPAPMLPEGIGKVNRKRESPSGSGLLVG
jgi:hypothetical protein